MIRYAELHCASAFSFLEGASLPEELAQRAVELGLSAVALCDRNGVYGAPRFYRAAKKAGLKALVGAEVELESGDRLTVLVGSRAGYQNLCRLLTCAAEGKAKGQARATWEQVAAHAEGLHALTGGAEGALVRAWGQGRDLDAVLGPLREAFDGRVHIELQRHRRRDQEFGNRALVELARRSGAPLAATNGVRFAQPADKPLQDALTCIRLKTTLEDAGTRLAINRERHLKTPAQMFRLFADLPEAVRGAAELAERLDFTLADLGYRLPDYPLAPGETTMSELRRLTWAGAKERFLPLTEKARAQLEHELAVIEKLDLAGYFLIVWDIVRFCRERGILVQGRGSAANSAVCYALSITAVDPVKMELLFERFLSEERGEWPDIDLDLPSGERRERVIQYVYAKYGARAAAMTANVVTYRSRSAVREAAKVLGLPAERVDALSNNLGDLGLDEIREAPKLVPQALARAGLDPQGGTAKRLIHLWRRMQNLPRHLGQHSGGMVIAGGSLDRIVPLEPASMPGRVVIQWDKDDCSDLGLIKIDLLGLGMLAVLEEAVPLIERHEGVKVDLAHLPPGDPKVYEMLNKADTVGVFQLESRAQMATLPRNGPERFYDIVVQVAIIRPGPIVGGMVRPFFDRRQGKAPVEYPHPCLEPILKRTLGVPLFQEQVLRMAMAAASFTGGEAEELRRAMGFKRSVESMEAIGRRLHEGMEKNGIPPEAREQIYRMITSFALYGFPESHAASFALIAYASAYLRARHPECFTAALLNAWPMGFYHPATIVKDAQQHGVVVRGIDVNESGWSCRVEGPPPQPSPQGGGRLGVRLGLRYISGLREGAGRLIEAGRAKDAFKDVEELARRCALREEELNRLAHAGALSSMGLTRREALWQAARAAKPQGPLFDEERELEKSPLPEMAPVEETLADYASAQLTTGPHLVGHIRERLTGMGVRSAAELRALPDGAWVRAAGVPIIRQRPATAKGFVFLTLEDETGMVQAIVSPKLFRDRRAVVTGSAGLVVEGPLQKEDGALSVKAARVEALPLRLQLPSRDFR